MNDFLDSLKDIKKEMVKELGAEKKSAPKPQITKEEAVAHKEQKLRNEFLNYTKNHNINKI
ncbi:MAG: hypothetical protein ACTTJC_01590 [Campylobacter sp.]